MSFNKNKRWGKFLKSMKQKGRRSAIDLEKEKNVFRLDALIGITFKSPSGAVPK
jgi:hypothetical protein